MTLALMGSSHGETEPQKATYLGTGRNVKPRLDWSLFPPHPSPDNGTSLGNPVVEMATPKGTQQSNQGNE